MIKNKSGGVVPLGGWCDGFVYGFVVGAVVVSLLWLLAGTGLEP